MKFRICQLTKVESHQTVVAQNWYYDDLVKLDVLIDHADLSEKLKTFIWNQGNYLSCKIHTGSFIDNNVKFYIVPPIVLGEWTVNDIADIYEITYEVGDILSNESDWNFIKSILKSSGEYYSLVHLETIPSLCYIEILEV